MTQRELTADEFWAIIEQARDPSGSAEQTATNLADLAAEWEPPQMVAFEAWNQAYRNAANRQELWCAVAVLRGGCSDDSWTDFRAWLVAQGRDVYTRVVADPDELASESIVAKAKGRKRPTVTEERMNCPTATVYEAAVEQSIFDVEWPARTVPEQSDWADDRLRYGWSDDGYEALVLFPNLAARFTTATWRRKAKEQRDKVERQLNAMAARQQAMEDSEPVPYKVSASFEVGDLVAHSKFGTGLVLEDGGDRLVARFEAGEKTLVQRR
ncbi:MAG: DUF4240 domain-containing protein [Myxococcota bacterium]